MIGHRFALATNAGPQGLHGAHRAAHRNDPSAAALPAANREGSIRLLSGLIGWGHDGRGSCRPHRRCHNLNWGVSVGVHGCSRSSSRASARACSRTLPPRTASNRASSSPRAGLRSVASGTLGYSVWKAMPRAVPFLHRHTGGGSLPGWICSLRGEAARCQLRRRPAYSRIANMEPPGCLSPRGQPRRKGCRTTVRPGMAKAGSPVTGHRFALGTDAGPPGIHGAHRAERKQSSLLLLAAQGNARFDRLRRRAGGANLIPSTQGGATDG